MEAEPNACKEKKGSNSGAQRHFRAKEKLCDPCKEAKAAYDNQWRADNPQYMRRQRAKGKVRDAALRRLAFEYPHRYKQLLEEESKREIEKTKNRPKQVGQRSSPRSVPRVSSTPATG